MDIDKLHDFISKHTVRGACTCGQCIDAPDNPEANQPEGHVANLTFFKVSLTGDPSAEEFTILTEGLLPTDGSEINYLTLGGLLGDQGFALQVMGMGALLGAWTLLSPDTMAPFLDDATKQKMAGMGMVSIKAKADDS